MLVSYPTKDHSPDISITPLVPLPPHSLAIDHGHQLLRPATQTYGGGQILRPSLFSSAAAAAAASHHHHAQQHPLSLGYPLSTLAWMSSARGKPRRGMMRRAVFSDAQRQGLEKRFQLQKYISKPDRKKLAEELGLKDSQVCQFKIKAAVSQHLPLVLLHVIPFVHFSSRAHSGVVCQIRKRGIIDLHSFVHRLCKWR